MSNFSKQDAIEDLKTIKTFFEEESGAFPVSLEYAINFLESDIVEVVHGEWIYPYKGKHYKRCSVCGMDFYSIPWDSKFCPNCGAEMRGGKDE